MKPIIMPQVGQDIPDALISRWLKKENDRVEKGEVVLVVESDKASFEVEAECSGVLLKVLHQEGDRVDVFKPVAYVGEEAEKQAVAATAPVAGAATAAVEPQPLRHKPAASPSARRIARESGIDLARIQGTGPGQRIVKRDLLSSSAPPGDEVVPFTRMRKFIAGRLSLSKRTIPHFHLFVDVDMTGAQQWRRAVNAEQTRASSVGPRTNVTVTDLVVHAVAQALREFRRLNAHVEGDQIIVRKNINVGVATAVEEGLLVPVIADADALTLARIAERSRQNAEAARRGAADPRGVGTFTVSSLGMFGISRFLPIINPPECAILGVGSAEPRVVPVPGGIGVREMMTLDLACDHRAVDGAYAAAFLNRVKATLEAIGRSTGGSSGSGGRT